MRDYYQHFRWAHFSLLPPNKVVYINCCCCCCCLQPVWLSDFLYCSDVAMFPVSHSSCDDKVIITTYKWWPKIQNKLSFKGSNWKSKIVHTLPLFPLPPPSLAGELLFEVTKKRGGGGKVHHKTQSNFLSFHQESSKEIYSIIVPNKIWITTSFSFI